MPRDLFGDVTRPSISVGNRSAHVAGLANLSFAHHHDVRGIADSCGAIHAAGARHGRPNISSMSFRRRLRHRSRASPKRSRSRIRMRRRLTRRLESTMNLK